MALHRHITESLKRTPVGAVVSTALTFGAIATGRAGSRTQQGAPPPQKADLQKLVGAFASGGPFRPGERASVAIKRARATQKAVVSLSKTRGISIEQSKKELIRTAERIRKTRSTLAELRGQAGRRSSVGPKSLAARAGHGSIRIAELVLRNNPPRRRR